MKTLSIDIETYSGVPLRIPKEFLLTLEDKSVIKWAFNAAFKRICLLSTMTEEFYSYKNGALVFTQKAPRLFIYLNL